jgi:hypothetical protein
VISAGTVITGGVVSCTVTVNDFVDVFELASEAEQCTVVTPSGKVLPDSGTQLIVGDGSTVSTAVAVYETTAPPGPVASAVISAGTVITGGVVSWIFTWNDAVAVFENESVALQFTVVVPSGKTLPDVGMQVRDGEGSDGSVTVTV